MPLTGGESDSVRLTNNSPLILTLKKSQPSPDVLVTSSFRFAYAPIPRGSTLALASVTFEGETSESVLIADESVKVKDIKRGFWQRLKDLFNKDHKD